LLVLSPFRLPPTKIEIECFHHATPLAAVANAAENAVANTVANAVANAVENAVANVVASVKTFTIHLEFFIKTSRYIFREESL
jgi:hypothetical protein